MAEKNIVPSLETKATDWNPVFTRKQWLERFRQFCKREHKIDITPLLKREDVKASGWTGREKAIQEDFIWGVGPEALYQITRAEYRTEPDSIKIKDLIRLFTEYYRNATLTTTEEVYFGLNKPKIRHQMHFGEESLKSKKNAISTQSPPKNCWYQYIWQQSPTRNYGTR